jgi:hypothetical protein
MKKEVVSIPVNLLVGVKIKRIRIQQVTLTKKSTAFFYAIQFDICFVMSSLY